MKGEYNHVPSKRACLPSALPRRGCILELHPQGFDGPVSIARDVTLISHFTFLSASHVLYLFLCLEVLETRFTQLPCSACVVQSTLNRRPTALELFPELSKNAISQFQTLGLVEALLRVSTSIRFVIPRGQVAHTHTATQPFRTPFQPRTILVHRF